MFMSIRACIEGEGTQPSKMITVTVIRLTGESRDLRLESQCHRRRSQI